MVEVAERQDDTIYQTRRPPPPRHDAVSLWGSTVKRWKVCDRPSDTAIPIRQKLLSYRFGTDPGLAVLCFKMWALLFLGLPDQAARISEQVLAELPSHGHAPTVALCNFFAVVLPEFAVRRS